MPSSRTGKTFPYTNRHPVDLWQTGSPILVPCIPPHISFLKWGAFFEGKQCQNLEQLTFADSSFDLFITQDVMEHVLHPMSAFKEIVRVLKPGGAHIFTVPWVASRATEFRAVLEANQIRHLKEPEFHGNPSAPHGSLVVTDWGYEMGNMIYEHTEMRTKRFLPHDSTLGIVGDCLDVFISYKPS